MIDNLRATAAAVEVNESLNVTVQGESPEVNVTVCDESPEAVVKLELSGQGAPGEPGVGIASVEYDPVLKPGRVGRDITFVLTDGRRYTAQVFDGADGERGPQGVPGTSIGIKGQSVEFDEDFRQKTTIEFTDGTIITVQDGKNGADGKDGEDGHTPVKGIDYWTEEDQQQIIDRASAVSGVENIDYKMAQLESDLRATRYDVIRDSFAEGIDQKYLPFVYPDEYNGTYKPVRVYTDGKHYITDFSAYNFRVSGGNVIYAAPDGEADNHGTRMSPKNLYSAIDAAIDGDTVILLNGEYSLHKTDGLINNTALFDKSINLIGEGDVRLLLGGISFGEAGSYDDAIGLWKCSFANATQVIDKSLRYRWEVAASIEECRLNPGTYYYDSTVGAVYLNSTTMPSAYIHRDVSGISIHPTKEAKLYFENIEFIGGCVSATKPEDAILETIWYRCSFLFACSAYNGFRVNSGHTLCVQCRAAYSSRDGFNYTPSPSGSELQFVEVDCVGDNNGLFMNTTANCNGSTSHGGAKGIRINGVYVGNYGPNIADVQSNTQTINLGCIANYSKGADSNSGHGISAQQSGTMMWIYNCQAKGNAVDLYGATGTTVYYQDCIFEIYSLNGTKTGAGDQFIYAGYDLNEYTNAGKYICSSETIASSLINCPSSVRFVLEVFQMNTYCMQIIYAENAVYTRRSGYINNGYGWKSWYKYSGTEVK